MLYYSNKKLYISFICKKLNIFILSFIAQYFFKVATLLMGHSLYIDYYESLVKAACIQLIKG